jgi:hypothetical protein
MFEYVYTEKQYKRSVKLLILSWAFVFVARVVLFMVYGSDFVYSPANLLLISVSGIIVGLTVRTFIIHKKSASLDPEKLILDSPK